MAGQKQGAAELYAAEVVDCVAVGTFAILDSGHSVARPVGSGTYV